MDALSLEEINALLINVKDRPATIDVELVRQAFRGHKAEALAGNDEALAKHFWCLAVATERLQAHLQSRPSVSKVRPLRDL